MAHSVMTAKDRITEDAKRRLQLLLRLRQEAGLVRGESVLLPLQAGLVRREHVLLLLQRSVRLLVILDKINHAFSVIFC